MIANLFTSNELFDIYVKDAEHPFSGWDFSFIENRMVTAPLTWSYDSLVIPFIRKASTLLDMGTGGGEKLASFQPLPSKTHATEAYEPNLHIAKKKLEPLGVKVVKISDDILPFENEFFNVIINRHESYLPEEVKRVLQKGGFFITQQVGGTNDIELNQFFNPELNSNELEYSYWNLEYACNQLEDAGLEISLKKECSIIHRCFDIGAIIYYLKAIPWEVPGFSIKKYKDRLFSLHLKILEEGFFDMTSQRFFIIAKKE
jgi:SAM-dependent methyltransferase